MTPKKGTQASEQAMPFPESPRVIYGRNPLSEVICQVRFPPVLRIEAEVPAIFQERIRREFPLFRELQPDLSARQIPPELANMVRAMMATRSRGSGYEFASEDGAWSITLSRDSLALRTTTYRRWEGFRQHLEGPLSSLAELYKPGFFSRIGLRYVDAIQRSKLELDNKPWSELLTPHIAGAFAAPGFVGQMEHVACELRVKLVGEGSVMIRHGIAVEPSTNEQCFVIDSDFFVERRLEPQHALGLLNDFNRKSGRLFRWCIQDMLHRAMEPTEVPD